MSMELAEDVRGLTRTGIEVRKITNAWKSIPGGDRFIQALITFLGGKTNKGTQRVYAFALTEFFNWYKQLRGFYPLPNNVLRADAVLYVKWLQERGLGIDDLRLAQDPDRELDLAIYKFVRQNPETRITSVRQHLLSDPRFVTLVQYKVRGTVQTGRVLKIEQDEPHGDEREEFEKLNGFAPDSALDLRLACLCMHNLLRRSPTIQQIRDGEVDLGLPDPEQAQITFRVDPGVFRYWANTYTEAKGTDRSGTIATKLSALSSFWTWLVKSSGENLPGFESLLRFNIWREVISSVRVTAINRAKAHREQATPDRELFLKVLSACYKTSHGDDALQAASAALEGADVSRFSQANPSIYDLRDRAVLIFLFWTGVRAEELGSIRRTSYEPATGLVTIKGKGDLTRIIRTPDPAMLAIRQFQAELDVRADEKSATLFSKFIAEPEAPLFPPVKLWGRAARIVPTTSGQLPGLSPSGLAKLLHERAEEAGIEQGSDDYYRIHPHGLRHLAALEANRRGVDVATIQSTLGHGSLATTGIYLEVRDPMARSLQPDQPPRKPSAAPEPVTFEAEAEVAQAARPEAASERIISGALPPRDQDQPTATKPKKKPAEERKRRIVSFETELKKSAADRAVESMEKAAEAAKEAAVAAKAAIDAAAVVQKSIEQEAEEIPDVTIKPAEREEQPLEVITPPEQLFIPPTEEEIAETKSPAAIEKLVASYETNWGENGRRSHLLEQKSKAEREREAQALGEEGGEEVEEGLLTHAYVGKMTSFGWWTGTLGKMDGALSYTPNVVFPAMPILSPDQLSEGLPDDNPIARDLTNLFAEWFQEPERGPSAADALVAWVRLASVISDASTAVIESRSGEWIEFDSALVTQPNPKKPSILREHLPGAILAWFESTAWQWVPAASGYPTGKDWDPPNWYDEPDPLASLDEGDRNELLDWLRVLTGEAPKDTTPRFEYGASRAQLGKLLAAVCNYESLMQDEAEAAATKGLQLSAKEKKMIAESNDKQIRNEIKRITKGAVSDFSYAEQKAKRKKDRVEAEIQRARAVREAEDEGLDEKEKRKKIRSAQKFSRMLRGFYLDSLASVFGESVKDDPILDTQALCTQGVPLDDEEYKNLFRVQGQTIQHTQEFIRQYAKRYGQYSECVARRLARHLWEAKKFSTISESGRSWVNDPLLNSFRLVRYPCPASQEQDLRNVLGESRSGAVVREMESSLESARAIRMKAEQLRLGLEAGSKEAASIIKEIEARAEERRMAEEYETSAAQEYARDVLGGYEENPRSGLRAFNPVKLIFIANYMRRSERR